MTRAITLATIVVVTSAARADVAPTPPPKDVAAPRADAPARSGLAVGVELGEPASATVGWFAGRRALLAALGSGTLAGAGLSLHADAQLEVKRLRPDLSLRVGLGARYYHHGYAAMSVDELPDTHLGVRASAALALDRGPLQLYAELAPGLDLKRTGSCSYRSGASSVCPHALESPLFLQFDVGVRWFLPR